MLITAPAVPQQMPNGRKPHSSTTNGILQRFEIQLSTAEDMPQHGSCCSTSQQLEIIADPADAEHAIRCPCCRSSQTKLICVNCLCTNVLRIGRVRDELRRLDQSKIAVCNLIESVLIDEVKFESDFHQIRRSIEDLKGKIAWKKDQVGRLRQRIANMEGQSKRNHRNVVLLEKKMVSHADRILRTNIKLVDTRTLMSRAKIELIDQIALIAKRLFQIFHLEKRQLFAAGGHVQAWSGQAKVHRAAYLLNHCLCLDRTALLAKTVGQADHHPNGSSPPHESLAALAFVAQFAELLADLLDFHLPYANRQLHKGMMLLSPAGGDLALQEAALRQALFKLDYSCLHLCLGRGVPPEECELTEPLANLHALITRISAGKIFDCVPRLDQRLHRQICEQFTVVQPDGRVLSEFTLDNVENDWVKVHYTS